MSRVRSELEKCGQRKEELKHDMDNTELFDSNRFDKAYPKFSFTLSISFFPIINNNNKIERKGNRKVKCKSRISTKTIKPKYDT